MVGQAIGRVAGGGDNADLQVAGIDLFSFMQAAIGVVDARIAAGDFGASGLAQFAGGRQVVNVQVGFQNVVELPIHFVKYAQIEGQVVRYRIDHHCSPAVWAGQQVGQGSSWAVEKLSNVHGFKE